jgi:hypothetical protein
VLAPTAKTESRLSSSSLRQFGQAGLVDPWTISSNWWLQARQRYSKIGIV